MELPWRGKILLTCEHGGYELPPEAEPFFRGAEADLISHRGWDPGALELARHLNELLDAPLLFATTSRLLVELNRSTWHKRWLSNWSGRASAAQIADWKARFYTPYRQQVEAEIASSAQPVLHIGVHTFTRHYEGAERTVDIGLLYDPARAEERALCKRWKRELSQLRPDLTIRRNQPYTGKTDGLTTTLRKRFTSGHYLGIELEVCNDMVAPDYRPEVGRLLASALRHDDVVCTPGNGSLLDLAQES